MCIRDSRQPSAVAMSEDPLYRHFVLPELRAARVRAEQERQRAEQERQQAEQARARAERLAAKLRALGIDDEGG